MEVKNIDDFKGNFFSILAETALSQVGVMTIAPGKDSGPEGVHAGDQLVYVVEGKALVEIDKEKTVMKARDVVIVPKGTQHHVYNNGEEDLFFMTVYAPPQY